MRRNYADVEYCVPGRKRCVAGSTVATKDFLVMVHEENPAATIVQLKQIITDKRKFILFPDAVAVLDAHIKAGYGNSVPDWR